MDIGLKSVNSLKFDIIVYADDILLMSTSKKGLQDQIDVAQKSGDLNEIAFNPSKTTFMIFYKNVARTAQERRLDLWQEDINIKNTGIKQITHMRYLGVEISDDDKNLEHLNLRKRKAMAAVMKLKSLGLIDNSIHPITKGHIYKTYIRPVLFYGLENSYLTKTEILKIKRIEGNLIKTIIGIPTRCKTSDLMYALRIEPTSHRIDLLKNDFYLCLISNKYTKHIIDLGHDVKDILKEIENTNSRYLLEGETPISTEDHCKFSKYAMKTEIKANCKNNPRVVEIVKIFNLKNREEIPKKLAEFDAAY